MAARVWNRGGRREGARRLERGEGERERERERYGGRGSYPLAGPAGGGVDHLAGIDGIARDTELLAVQRKKTWEFL
jgi:hypothetical protein